jgi:MGT family glycosyltransferase
VTGRIVYFSFPAQGHINPTLPVIRELADRGEQIVYYGTPRFSHTIGETGAQFRPYTDRMRMPEHGPGPFAQVSTTLETLLEFCGVVLDQHLEQVRSWRPTHIMFDSFAPWGRMVARLLELPTIASVPSILMNGEIDARYGSGPERAAEDPRLTAQWFARFRARCVRLAGITPPELLQTYGDFNLVYTSRLFQPLEESFDRRRFQFVGPCCTFRPDVPLFPFEQLDGRPLVLNSQGTVYGRRPDFLRKCMVELADGPWQVVLATGGDTRIADGVPENFIVRPSVPQLEILRRAAVFVTHGGMNSVQEALYYGVPMVMEPQAADQFWISARAAELGAAVVLDSSRLKAGTIRTGVAEVLAGANYASAARCLGQSLRAAGGHIKAADEIQSCMSGARGKKSAGALG